MEAVTPKDFFENVLPKRFKAEKTAGVDVVVQVDLTGPDGGNWVATVKDKKLGVKEGLHPSPTLSLKMADKDFLDIVNGKLRAETAFFTGKVHFKGDITLALKLKETGFL